MAGNGLASQFERRLGKRDQIADAHQFGDLLWQQAGIHEQMFQWDGVFSGFRRQEIGGRLDDHAGDGFAPLYRDQCSRQDARVHPADLGDAEETVHDSGHHQADGIHVGGDHHRWARLNARAAPQSMQRAEFAAADFMNKRPPFIFDDLGGWVFVAGKSGSGDQVFEEGEEFGHEKS